MGGERTLLIRTWAELNGEVSASPTTPSRAPVRRRRDSSSRPRPSELGGVPEGARLRDEAEVFYVGALAEGLGRSVTTIRWWESVGVLPRPPFLSRIVGDNISQFRRAYMKDHIAVAERIAEEMNLLGRRPKAWASSEFPRRVPKA